MEEKQVCPWCGCELTSEMWRDGSLVAACSMCPSCKMRGPMAAVRVEIEFMKDECIKAAERASFKVFDAFAREL